MRLLTSTSQVSTPRHQRSRGSQIVSLLLAATVLLSVFAQTATGNSALRWTPNPGVETLSGLDSNIPLATVLRHPDNLNITDPNQPITAEDMKGLTRLLRRGASNISSLAGLEHATNLDSLTLDENSISDLTPLKGLTKLEWLYLENNRISDLTPLKGLTELKYLYLENNRISDLTPLKGLTKLYTLDLHNNRISDLTPLKGLTKLQHLYLNNNRISDLTPLSHLPKLYSLYLESNKIRDISALSGLTLGAIWLADNAIANIDPIMGRIKNGGIFRITLDQNAIPATDIEAIASSRIRFWSAEGQSPEVEIPNDTLRAALQALEGTEAPTHKFISELTSLDLSGEKINNFTGLEAAINLTSLTLNNTEMTQRRLSKLAEVLAELPKLRELDLGNSKISNIVALSGLTKLTTLKLHGNTISDVSVLRNFSNLTELHLNDNTLNNIDGLASLTGLETLNLNGNRIVDVSPLAGLTGLKYLFLSRNRIVDVSSLAGLPVLRELTLDHNRIADFASIQELTDGLPNYQNDNQDAEPVVKIKDPSLRSAVLTALGRADDDTAPISMTEMASLTTLTAQDAGITRLNGLQHAVNLRELDLSGNALDDNAVSFLLRLTQLETLILIGNADITNPKPFRKLQHLTTLRLPEAIAAMEDPVVAIPDAGLRTAILQKLGKPETPETEITASDLHDLEVLQASGYGISDLTGLEHAVNLKELYLNDNQLSDLSSISGLKRLRRLSLNNNNISDVSALKGVTTLRWLRLNDNRLSAVASLDSLSLLHTLEISNNRISDVTPLTALVKLNTLVLDGNPIDTATLPAALKSVADPEGVGVTSFNLLDVNRDGSVNQDDVDIVSRLTGIPSGDLIGIENATKVYPDVDGDGDVDEADIAAVKAAAEDRRTSDPSNGDLSGSGGE